jgi:hypothetical protein
VVKSVIFVLIFFMMTSLAMAGTHHKKKRHPKPKPTPKVSQLRPEDLQWLIQ